MIEIKAVFRRKDNEIEATGCVIDKVVRLSGAEFDNFSHNMMRSWDFIRDNPINMIVDSEGRHHCLLVTGEGRCDGILVNSEGSDYARYSAFIPNAQQIIFMEQRYNCIQDLEGSLMKAADEVVSCALAYNGEGDFRVLISDLEDEHGLDKTYIPLLCEMLREHSNISDTDIFDDEIIIGLRRQKSRGNPDISVDTRALAAWQSVTEAIAVQWREDTRYQKHRDGALYYLGNKSGQYMLIKKDGTFVAGQYELADPGIEDAVLLSQFSQQMGSYEQALALAYQFGGQRFFEDIYTAVDSLASAVELRRASERPTEKPSVMEQIREARKNPQPHAPSTAHDKGGPEL